MAANEEETVWLTQQEACEYLDVSRETVRRKAKEGLFKRYGNQRNARYRKDELTEYLRVHEPWKLP